MTVSRDGIKGFVKASPGKASRSNHSGSGIILRIKICPDNGGQRGQMNIFLVELPVFLLLSGKGKQNLLIGFSLYILFCVMVLILQKGRRTPKLTIQYPAWTIMICLLCGLVFFLTWGSSARFASVSEAVGMPGKQCCLIIALFLSVFAAFGIDTVIRLIVSVISRQQQPSEMNPGNAQIRLYIFLTSFLTITLHSKCSPLYPFNDWGDPNTMFTVGKAILKGYVPYRDLYEQKGPLILFLHTVGAAVSFDSFIGMWLLEILAAFFFLLISYRLIRLFHGRMSVFVIPLLSVIVYGCFAFLSGDSAEEICLPFLAYALYVGCRALEKDDIPSKKEFFLVGLTSACIFWIKYSMVSFYPGWIIVLFLYAAGKKKIRPLLTGCVSIFFGVIVTTIPVLAWFAANSSLNSLWEAYFYNNFHYYPAGTPGVLERFSTGFRNLSEFYPVVLVVSSMGFLWTLVRRRWKTAAIFGLTFLFLMHFVYYGGRNFQYYGMVFGFYAVFGLFWLIDILSGQVRIDLHPGGILSGSFFLSLLLLCVFSNNMRYLKYEKEDLFQYRFKQIIEASGKEDPTVFNYKALDFGVNTTAGLIPDMRFFCWFNLIAYAPMENEMSACLDSACADYIVAFSKYENSSPEFDSYEHAGWIPGEHDSSYGFYHYYVPRQDREKKSPNPSEISGTP